MSGPWNVGGASVAAASSVLEVTVVVDDDDALVVEEQDVWQHWLQKEPWLQNESSRGR